MIRELRADVVRDIGVVFHHQNGRSFGIILNLRHSVGRYRFIEFDVEFHIHSTARDGFGRRFQILVKGQEDGKHRTLTLHGRNTDFALHAIHNLLHQSQAHSRAHLIVHIRRLLKCIKNVRQIFFRNTPAIVSHTDADIVAFGFSRDCHSAILVCEFDGIANEVAQNFL